MKNAKRQKPDKLNLQSMIITEEQKKKLKQLFPEVFNEKKIDWEKLKATLGEELDNGQERYNMNWPGKKDCFQIIQEPSLATLKPFKKESLDWDKTQNLFIEGDNLEVLKLLQKSYYSKVKMIYIDPPYNTGKDFIYPDKHSETLETYLQYTGQKDAEGKRFSTNQETDGRFHSKWINMMYPRLFLARNLLRDDGVICISIDENEVTNLRKICDEIFGEENFINCINIKTKIAGVSGSYLGQSLQKNIEYVLFYCKDNSKITEFNDIYEEKNLFSYIKEYKEKGKSWKYTRVITSFGNKKFYKKIKDGTGKEIKIFKHENVKFNTIDDLIEKRITRLNEKNLSKEEKDSLEKEIHLQYFDKIFRDTNAQSSIRKRVIDATKLEDDFLSIEYTPESGKNKGNITTLYYKGRNKDLIAWLKDVSSKSNNTIIKKDKIGTLWSDLNWNNISKEGNIQYPNGKKPILLIKRMIGLIRPKADDIVMDFFSGSGSTIHATMEYNKENQNSLRTISIQLPEVIQDSDKTKYYNTDDLKWLKTVADIGKERIRRAIKKIKEDSRQQSLLDQNKNNLDLGFKVFKLDKSNFKIWDEEVSKDKSTSEQVQMHLEDFVNPKSSEEDVLYEILIKTGFQLTTKIKALKLDNKTVYSVEENALLICLDKKITKELIIEIAKLKPARVVCLDTGFENNDQLKTNALETFKTHGVRDFKTV